MVKNLEYSSYSNTKIVLTLEFLQYDYLQYYTYKYTYYQKQFTYMYNLVINIRLYMIYYYIFNFKLKSTFFSSNVNVWPVWYIVKKRWIA